MKKKIRYRERPDELRRGYDLSELKGGVRGKYAGGYRSGRTKILLMAARAAK